MTSVSEAVILLLILGAFSFLSYKRQWLDNEGILIAWIVGLSTFLLGGWKLLVTLFVFFAIGETATYFSKGKKKAHQQRKTENILGNALASIVALLLQSPLGFFGAISASLADTLSSEIGILSKKKPLMITTLKPVTPGIDGGVSGLGLTASALGALIISALAFAFGTPWKLTIIVFFAGMFGSVMDSFFGATIQQFGWLDNNAVNFLGSSSGALFAFFVATNFGLL